MAIETSAARGVIGFEAAAGFLAARATETEALEILTREVRAHFAAPTEVVVDLSAKASKSGVRTVAALDTEERSAEMAKARANIERHPLVQESVRVFGAQIRDVKLPSSDG